MYRATLACVLASGCSLVFPLQSPAPDAIPDGPPAPITDGAGPDAIALTCPTDYNLPVASATHYRMIGPPTSFAEAAAACVADRGDATGFTHLVVLDDDQELQELATNLLADIVWVGLLPANPPAFLPISTQDVSYPPVAGPPWATDEPTDNDGCVVLDPNGGVLVGHDCATQTFSALCECDAFAPR